MTFAGNTNFFSGDGSLGSGFSSSNAYTVKRPSTRTGASSASAENIKRPPNPLTAGLPGWCNIAFVHTAATLSGVCGLGLDA